MKTTFLTIFAALILSSGIAKTIISVPAKHENITMLSGISAINKIEVHGNVELFISDGNTDQVKVYNKYYAEGALIQNNNGVLRISSYSPEKLVVWVTANDLRSVSAYDHAQINSFGNISKIEFNVDLHNNAVANLNFEAYSANVTVNDQAKVDLSGSVDEWELDYCCPENVNYVNLKTIHATKTVTVAALVKKSEIDEEIDELADL